MVPGGSEVAKTLDVADHVLPMARGVIQGTPQSYKKHKFDAVATEQKRHSEKLAKRYGRGTPEYWNKKLDRGMRDDIEPSAHRRAMLKAMKPSEVWGNAKTGYTLHGPQSLEMNTTEL